jgi:8-oxo-dGTP pyrophosphatase MutT (NUDIX family)
MSNVAPSSAITITRMGFLPEQTIASIAKCARREYSIKVLWGNRTQRVHLMPLNSQKNALLAELAAYQPYDSTEGDFVARTRDFLQKHDVPFSRKTAEGHITASAVVLDEARQSVLMIWHEKLERWLQPGGHCEPETDPSLPDAALRELVEETAIPPEAITLLQKSVFDMDIHPIPARGDETDHLHYDLRYLFQTTANREGIRWRAITELAQSNDESRSRFAKKLLKQPPKNWD